MEGRGQGHMAGRHALKAWLHWKRCMQRGLRGEGLRGLRLLEGLLVEEGRRKCRMWGGLWLALGSPEA